MKRIFILGFVLTAVLFSCSEGQDKKNDPAEFEKLPPRVEPVCLKLNYPITYIMPDGSKITGENREEVSTGLRSWHNAHPDVKEHAAMQFPVIAVFKGQTITINTDSEMMRYRKACEEPEIPCFALIYPVSYIMPDNTIITVEGIDDLESKTAIREWYEKHPNSKERPGMKYPINVLLEGGSVFAINSEDEMNQLREECE